MRRLNSLANNLYHRKYKEIYKILFNADLDCINDYSTWYKENGDWVDKNRPLWIVIESTILNKRIWVYKDFGKFGIDIAKLDLPLNSIEYSESHTFAIFDTQKELVNYLKSLLEPCLEEYKEEVKFYKNTEEWKDGLKYAEERKRGFYEKESKEKYLTLKEVGEKYSKKIANIMFELGYGEWIFIDSKTLDSMEQQIIDVLEDDKDLIEILEEKNITREQLYRNIKKNFLEEELEAYLREYSINLELIPEEISKAMINEVKKGMIDNYSYKYIIWDSGNLDYLIETLPDTCFFNEDNTNDKDDEEIL